MGYDAVIFDFDGVLLDSAGDGFEWADRIREKEAEKLGYSCSGREVCFMFLSDSFEEMKRKVDESPFTWHQYVEIEKTIARRKVEMVKNGDLRIFPGVEGLFESLEVRKALVSNAYGEAVDSIVRHLGFDNYLDYWTAPKVEEIERYHSIKKPETHMMERAIAKTGADNPVMVGDSWFDIEAAENVGIDSVFVERSHNRGTDLKPDHRITSLEELKEIV